jgi:catechol 2,3-dioxygenase-like lactoylglutathione lyase family enzyme
MVNAGPEEIVRKEGGPMAETVEKPRLVGINHVALEVGDIDEALDFYGAIFDFKLRGRHPGMAFIDLGDQFINLTEGRTQPEDRARHFGLVVDDRERVRLAVVKLGVRLLDGPGLDFLDPWGNHVQVVQYDGVQFTKTEAVLCGMGLEGLGKTAAALEELRAKGMGPD